MTNFPERSLQVLHFNEPLLEFNFKQTTPHPKDGLFLYGPHERAKKTKEVRVGIIGTSAACVGWSIEERHSCSPAGKN